jgi:hypothetical protein
LLSLLLRHHTDEIYLKLKNPVLLN